MSKIRVHTSDYYQAFKIAQKESKPPDLLPTFYSAMIGHLSKVTGVPKEKFGTYRAHPEPNSNASYLPNVEVYDGP